MKHRGILRPSPGPGFGCGPGVLWIPLALVSLSAGGCERDPVRRPPIAGEEIRIEIERADATAGGSPSALTVEVVFDSRSREVGLMFRESLPEDHGMLFVFPRKAKQRFWMRNTQIPLSIAFLSDDGEILEIRDMRPKDESRTESKHQVRYALEVNKGWFDRAGKGVGDRVRDFRKKVDRFTTR